MTRRLTTALTLILLAAAPAAIASYGSNTRDTPAQVTSPVIPHSVRFADSKVSLDETDMFERYDRELTSMAYTHGNTLLCIKRANKYFPVLSPILKRNGVPQDLLYLACIESTLNPTAVSGAGAAGLWQFMPATAREFGLEVNDDVDERYHIEKATEAACRYLKQAYAKFGNWESVAASYNGGQGRISRELSAQGVDTAYDLFLATETQRYIFRLLAMKEIMEHPSNYGYRLERRQLYQPADYETVRVDSAVTSWPEWALAHGIDYRSLREHNPWIRSRQLPNKQGKTYEVLIPTAKSRKRSTAGTEVFNHNWIK